MVMAEQRIVNKVVKI